MLQSINSMDEGSRNLDALIEVLDELDPPDENHQPTQRLHDGDETAPEEEDASQGRADRNQDTQDRRNNLARTIISSTSARRKMKKPEHCHFCPSFNDITNLGDHLAENELCFNLYSRMTHLKSIDAILSSLFTCIFCPTNDGQLASHLKSHNQCFQRYCQKFDVTTVRYSYYYELFQININFFI